MKTIKSILIAGAVIVSATVYAQTVPAPTPSPTPTTPTQPVPATPPTTQQNSETFNKPASERALNPATVPLQQGTNIRDTIIPGKTRMMTADSSRKSGLMKDSTIMNKKGSGEFDTTSTGKTGKGMKKRRDQ